MGPNSSGNQIRFTMATHLKTGTVVMLFVVSMLPVRSQAQLKESHLQRADRVKWGRVLKIPTDCENRFATTSENEDYSGLEFDRISKNESLVIVECYPGAYQPGVILYLLRDGPPQTALPLTLDGVAAETSDDGKPLPYQMFDGLVSFQRRMDTLEVLQKGRGLGDCGRFLRYHFRDGKFIAFEVREQACREKGKPGSTDNRYWPQIPIPKAASR